MARKWALITGASPGGMGEAEAAAFLKRGVNVIATSLDTQDAEYLQPEPGSDDGFLVTLTLDVTSPKSIAAAVEQVGQLTDGRLDFLWNNAGYGYYVPLLDADIDQAKKQYDVNVWGVLRVTQAFFPLLRAAKGTVVNQSSVSGIEGFNRPFMGVYSSSKAAVLSLSATLRVELWPFDIKVVTLLTSAVKTEFFANKIGGGIPDTSPYTPIKFEADALMSNSLSDKNGHDRYHVAESTIDELLRIPSPPVYIRKGYLATWIAWMHWILPAWFLDSQSIKTGTLDRLKQLLNPETDEHEKES